jgi:ataxin-10
MVPPIERRQDEVIIPHQTTLLKLLDSYLQTLHSPRLSASLNDQTLTAREELAPMLSESFLTLSTYAQKAIQRALTPANAVTTSMDSSRAPSASTDKSVTPLPTVEVSSSAWFEESSESEESEEFDKSPKSSDIHTASGSEKSTLPSPHTGEFDVSLPSVCEALVLITQCIVSLTLEIPSSAGTMKQHFNAARTFDGQGLIENLIGAWVP